MSVAPASPALPDDAPHVLVVDDDRRLRHLVASYLGRNGYRVTAVASASEARARLSSLSFEIIVLDVMMPGENGIALTGALREIRNIPVILLTALGEAESRVAGLEAGADDYLAKPFDPRELVLRINNILKRSVNPAKPKNPAVPDQAPAALRLPIVKAS